jgi:hypothetical protein
MKEAGAMPFPDGGAGSSIPAQAQSLPFPSTEAETAKVVCGRIAALLDDDLRARPGLVATAQDGWEGVHRAEFDETWSIQSIRLPGLKEDLLRLVGKIDDAMANVATINLQRANARDEHVARPDPVREA